MKKSSLALLIITISFILGSYIYTTLHRIETFEAPNNHITLGDNVVLVNDITYTITDLIGQPLYSISDTSGDYDSSFTKSLDEVANLQLAVSMTPQPERLTYTITHNDHEIYSSDLLPNISEIVTSPGDYEFFIDWDYTSSLGRLHEGSGMSTFKLHVYEKPVITLSQTSAKPGEFIKITADTSDTSMNLILSAPNLTTSLIFQEHEGQLETYFPIDYLEESSEITLTIHTNDHILETHTITIDEKVYETQHLIMSEETTSATLTEEAIAEHDAVLASIKGLFTPTRYFEDEFMVPNYGVITTDFGLIRYTNDNPIPRRHAALDIAAPTGTNIIAFASGEVVVSRFLQQTGNTVIIDHGQGLLSYHYHLDTLAVAEGDLITQGDSIGTVGTTGYSTGPHLHFAITLHDQYLDPWFFFNKEGFTFL